MKNEHEFLLLKCNDAECENPYFSFKHYSSSKQTYETVRAMGVDDTFFSCIWKWFAEIPTVSPSLDGSYAVPSKGLERFDITQFHVESACELERVCERWVESFERGPAVFWLDGDSSEIPERAIKIEVTKEKMIGFLEELKDFSRQYRAESERYYFVHLGV